MNHKRKFTLISLLAVAIIIQCVCIMAKPRANQDMDIVDVAKQNNELKTLVKALDAADLTDTLKGNGPFTVFAPTDNAFKKLPAGTLDELLKPQNKAKLVDLLTYHVKNGKVSSEQALNLNGQDIIMLNGKPAKIEVRNGSLYIDNAKVIMADVQAKNGVIHIIDAVMQP